MDPKSCKKSIKACSGGVSKRDLKNGPSPGSGKVRFCHYLLHFSKVGGLKQETFLGTILGTVWETKSLKTGFQNSTKKSAENRHPFYEILGPFWGPFLSKKSVVCRSKNKCVLHVGAREAGYIKMGPKIDDVGS